MMSGLSATADLVPATAADGSAVLAAVLGGQPSVLTDDFEALLVEGSGLDDGTDATADPVSVPDPWLALARAPETEPPAGDMPLLQDGAVAAPGLMQALEARAVDTVAPDRTTSDAPVDTVAMQRLSTIVSLPAHTWDSATSGLVPARRDRASGFAASWCEGTGRAHAGRAPVRPSIECGTWGAVEPKHEFRDDARVADLRPARVR
ncbi:hypothetical protein OWS73_18065 [Burkholderia sp. 1B3(2022)]|uniref:hypothetical protein n=1 Tax=Burkholderia sp. 1B3(2022) TaxID=2997425 RepID=UPI002FC99967